MNIRYEDIPHPFITLLERRGICGKQCVEEFLYPRLEKLPSPFLMKGMQQAVEIISNAIYSERNIVLWGDYDVDGTTGTALLTTFFRHLGVHVVWHIPDRTTEGYGLNIGYLQKLARELDDQSFLLITIDCGISNRKEILTLQEWGGEAIVTDHHTLPAELPPCTILNPNQPDCGFKEQHLAGVGVAFYLAAGLRMFLRSQGYFSMKNEPNLKEFLAHTALGTISDMVPLKGVNRTLVRAGLEVLHKSPFPGIQALLEVTEITDGNVLSDDIGFYLGPKLNAAGRMSSADLAVELLTCEDTEASYLLSKKIHRINIERKESCSQNLDYALQLIDPHEVSTNQCCIVMGPFHVGILGIIASRLMEIYQVPVIVLTDIPISSQNMPTIKGSCRSPEQYNIMQLLYNCEDILLAYGGHACAAGISLHPGQFETFRSRIRDAVKLFPVEKLHAQDVGTVDFSIYTALSPNNTKVFQLLEPFGKGNERPVLSDQSAVVLEYRCVGKNKEHLKVSFRSEYGSSKGIGFNLGAKAELLKDERRCSVVYTVIPNRFNGTLGWQIRIHDIAQAEN